MGGIYHPFFFMYVGKLKKYIYICHNKINSL